jgi:hypothetical protein
MIASRQENLPSGILWPEVVFLAAILGLEHSLSLVEWHILELKPKLDNLRAPILVSSLEMFAGEALSVDVRCWHGIETLVLYFRTLSVTRVLGR